MLLLGSVAVPGRAEGAEPRVLPRPGPLWAWPVAPPVHVTRSFEAPVTRYTAGHRGIDLAAVPGTTVLAPTGGIVSYAGRVVDRPVLTIAYGDGMLVSVEPVDSSLAAGHAVERGDPLGTVAAGGHCAERCLHLGVRVHGEYVSPLVFLGGIPRAVLLPLD